MSKKKSKKSGLVIVIGTAGSKPKPSDKKSDC